MSPDYVYSKDGTFRGYVEVDPFSMDPREWDNLGHMVCFHNKYSLGDKHDFKNADYTNWDEFRAGIEAEGGVLILPLGLYDHGGISMYVGNSHNRWDGGQVGFIYVTQADLDREGVTIERAKEILENEVKVYDAYLTGNVYRWGVEQRVASCTCAECTHWESVECNGEYIDHREAQRDMEACLANFEPAEVSA